MLIKGIPSGDGECWCLLVTKETFTTLSGKEPEDEFDKVNKKGPYCYRIYPNTLFDIDYRTKDEVYLFSVEAQRLSELT